MFGERLKQLRKKNGYTQITLSEELGVSKGTVAMWETGKRKPDFETLCRLSEMFDVRTDYLLGQSDDATSATLSEEAIDKLGKWSTEEEILDLIKLYLSIDEYGKQTVDYLIKTEAARCKNQGTSEDVSGIDIIVSFRS